MTDASDLDDHEPDAVQAGRPALLRFAVRVSRRFSKQRLPALSAQFAYYALFLLSPMLILLIALAARLPIEGLTETFLRVMDRALPADAYAVVADQVQGVQSETALHLISIAAVALYYGSAGLFRTVADAFNRAHGFQETRPTWQLYGLGVLYTLFAALVLVSAGVLLVAGPNLVDWLSEYVRLPDSIAVLVGSGLRWAIAGLAMLLLVSLVGWVAPDGDRPWRLVSPGYLFAVGGFLLVTLGFRVYVDNWARYNETYGALGGVMVLLAWIHLSGMALFMGPVIDEMLEKRHKTGEA